MSEAPKLWTPEGLAEYLGIPIQTIYKWNYQGTGPKPIHVGRHVRYRSADVERWLDENASKVS